MDPKPQLPEIKLDPNKAADDSDVSQKRNTPEELVAALFGGKATLVSGGLGALGSVGAGAVAGGGLLATKAGILALVLMGSAVAGGIGLAGYKMFGADEAGKGGGSFSLFAAKPPQAADSNAVAPVNADGSSASLDYIAAAAAKDKAAEAAAAAASASADAPAQNTAGDPVKDAAAADAARMAAEASAASGGAINAGSGSGAAGSMGRGLANVKKLGALSGAPGGGGSTSAGSGSGANVKLGENIANASKNGATSAFSRQGGGSAKTSSASRSVGGRSTGARTALRQVGVDQQRGRANSSAAAGRTYDGSSPTSGSAIGADGSAIGMDGVGDGAGAQGKSMPANAKGKPNEQDPPVPDAPAKDVTPWAKHLMGGMALGALAIAALMYASTMIKEAKALLAKGVLLIQPLPASPTAAEGWALIADAEAQLKLARLLIGAAIAASPTARRSSMAAATDRSASSR